MVKNDAYGCGIEPVTAALADVGCRTFFVADLAEAKRVRIASAQSTIYVLNGLYGGAGPVFADINARPVLSSLIEVAEWDMFVASSQWNGGFALNVDTGASRLGISLQEAAAFATRSRSPNHGITLLMSHLASAGKPDPKLNNRQIGALLELCRLYGGIPASLAGSSGIFADPRTQFELLRAGGALYGVNPTPGAANPMRPAIELQARILRVLSLASGETIAYSNGWIAKRTARLALVSMGYADGYPLSGSADKPLHAIVGGKRCRIVGRASMDCLAIDVTELPIRARRAATRW